MREAYRSFRHHGSREPATRGGRNSTGMEQKAYGRYRVTGELGRGALGAVYHAVDPLTAREVVLKTLSPLPSADAHQRLLREAEASTRIRHPNVVATLEVGEWEGSVWVASEVPRGRSLRQILEDGVRLPFEQVADLSAQVADALDCAQELGIVHHSLKPANVLIEESGRARVLGFGTGCVPPPSTLLHGNAPRAPRYLSPEQVLGRPVDPRSDIFSLGVVLYEMLTRRNPFEREGEASAAALADRIAREPHAPVRDLEPAAPAAFDRILGKALAKRPEDRFARAGEMARALRQALSPASGSPASQGANAPGGDLLADIDSFSRSFEEQEQASIRREQERRHEKQAALQAWGEAQAHQRAEFALKGEPPASAGIARPEGRSSALDLLRKKAAEQGPRVDPTKKKAEQDLAFDQRMRSAFQYLAAFGKELNDVLPVAGSAYDFIYFGRIEGVVLSDAFIDMRLKHMDGRDFLEHIIIRFRIRPEIPARATLIGADIERLEQMLQSMKVPFELQPLAKSDFGQVTRATFTIGAALPCAATFCADYDAGTVTGELVNVRRPGRLSCAFSAAALDQAVDDLARYVLGADADFEKYLRR